MTEVPPGVDPEAVAAVLGPAVGGLAGPLHAELIAGGRSNLTYVISDGEREWVLRRPPLAHVLPTAHDMAREYRVISALGGAGIPSPPPVLLCDDPAVLGVTFYVMERVAGHVVRDTLPEGWPDTAQTRRAMSTALISTLARLHGVVPADVGLGDFGRPAGFLERQVRRWWTQWEASRTRELPEMDELRRRLEAGLPESGRRGSSTATTGSTTSSSPPTTRGGSPPSSTGRCARSAIPSPTSACCSSTGPIPASPTRTASCSRSRRSPPSSASTGPARWSRRTRARTDRDVGSLEWYVALGHYKLAIIAEGIYARFLMGATVGEGFEIMGARVPRLVRRALDRATASGLPGLAG